MKQAARVLVPLFSVLLAASCRAPEKEAAPPPRAAPPVESADVPTRAPRTGASAPVIWLGLDGLDFELLDQLAAEGAMPNWQRLAEEGWSGRLATLAPLLSPILWTTTATGVPPDLHRVLDFQEVHPATGRKVPISGASRAVPAVWNLASAAGKKVGVVGWWATHPAEEVNGFFVSDRASPLLYERPSLSGVVFPAGFENGVAQAIARDGVVSPDEIRRFVDLPPGETAKALAETQAGRSRHPVAGLARVIGATRVSHRIARDLYDRERPDLLALYLEGTDEVGHLFASFAPPKLACVSDADFARYGRAVASYYGLVDRMIGQWMRRAREDGATLLVSSDHGFKWGSDRPCGFASGNWATAAFWHRPEGVVAAWGARVRPSRERGSAGILDLAPSTLALLGLPADRRMTGVLLPGAFRDVGAPRRENLFPEVGVRRVSAQTASESQSDDYVRKLIALGYLSPSDTRPLAPSGGDRPGMTEGAWNNLGVYLRDTRRDPGAAEKAFQESLALRPDYYSALFNMAVLERARGDAKAAEKWFFRSVTAVGGDPAPAVLQWARDVEKSGDARAARSVLEKALHSYPRNEEIARGLAMNLFRERECRRAVGVLAPFEAATTSPHTFNVL
ncbi:MAG TPA: alkaline phosphatase family protein, partial [Thermoanaerobaculia bacterium]|nr:alkaline phosphatase family protein [Thermoanaerobaculia bacterium]